MSHGVEEMIQLIPIVVEKQPNKTNRKGLSWPTWVVQMILEMLSHRTPPSCIAANILTVAEILFSFSPTPIIKELPSTNFIRECRTVLLNTTKTLAAFQLGNEKEWVQFFGDGTSRRQIEIQNAIVAVMTEGGFKTPKPWLIHSRKAASCFKDGRTQHSECFQTNQTSST
jgi:hypothetical protein